jgi:hypothetical protein
MEHSAIDRETVEKWMDATSTELEGAQEQARAATELVATLEERLQTLSKLLEPLNAESGNAPDDLASVRADRAARMARLSPTCRRVVEKAVELLEETGKPLQIREIHQQFHERGWWIPGRGEKANIIVHLRNSRGVIVSKYWGEYGLREHFETGTTAAA